MNALATFRHTAYDPGPDQRDVFRARCEARAILVSHGHMDFHDAVDGLQAAAVDQGLVARIGQDEVQKNMAEAFARGAA